VLLGKRADRKFLEDLVFVLREANDWARKVGEKSEREEGLSGGGRVGRAEESGTDLEV